MDKTGSICKNSYNALLKNSKQQCDFCDKIFHNRFQSIIHNASHIIIPLIKQTYCTCNKCNCNFTSARDLDAHLETVHNIKRSSHLSQKKSKIKLSIVDQYESGKEVTEKFNNMLKLESIDESCNAKEKITHNLNINSNTKKANVNKLSINRKNIFKNDINCSLNNTNSNKDDIYKCEIKVNDNTNEKIKLDTIKIKLEDTEGDVYHEPKNDGKESIKSRLQFEGDDIFDNSNVLNEFITECKVEMYDLPFNGVQELLTSHIQIENDNKTKDILNKQLKHNGFKGFENLKDDCESLNMDGYGHGCMQPQRQCKDEIKSQIIEPEYKSIHYQDLMKPGIFNCKHCLKSYPNRFNLIKHEINHIKLKKKKPLLCTYCDRYIAGNYHKLRSHIRRTHPTVRADKKRETYNCSTCGLKYKSYSRHVMNYHPSDCPEEDHEKNMCPTNKPIVLLNVCDLCYAFMKVTRKCILTGSINELGVRHECERCNKKFFQLKTVKYWVRENYLYGRRETKKLSNKDRLKKFQQRLKKINSLNKFYNAVLFDN